MPGIFINYRRDDAAGFARSLYEHLDQEFRQGQVFMDVEALREPGIDFAKEIDRSLARCAAMLVLIGKSWLTSTDDSGRRRIDEPQDFVRLEIATALKRDVRVIPVLLGGATMPRTEELPADLQTMGRRQAIAITHDDWAHDVSRLVEALAKVPGIRKRGKRGQIGWSTRSLVIAGTAGAALGLGLLGWAGFEQIVKPADKTEPEPAQTYVPQPVQTTPAAPAAPAAETYAPSPSPAASSADVYRVQSLLADLGYDAGVVNGVSGAATIGAIQSFQYDEGLTQTGTIDGELISQLESASQRRSGQSASTADDDVYEQPAAYTDPPPAADSDPALDAQYQAALAALAGGVDLTGTWYDDNGNRAFLVQEGNVVTVAAMNAATGLPQVIGSGVVQGRSVTIDYETFVGVPGTVRAELAPDGRHLNGTDTNALLNVPVPQTWHWDHPPGE